MDANPFLDKASPPTAKDLRSSLGPAAPLLDELKSQLPAAVVEQWKHYGSSSGWTLKLLLGKRNLCFVLPRKGCFDVAFVFGDKAVKLVEGSQLPPSLVRELVDARKYAEGRGLRVQVRSRRALGYVRALLEIKQR